jgi:hypothetical protein
MCSGNGSKDKTPCAPRLILFPFRGIPNSPGSKRMLAVLRPQLFPGHHFPRAFDQHTEYLEGLLPIFTLVPNFRSAEDAAAEKDGRCPFGGRGNCGASSVSSPKSLGNPQWSGGAVPPCGAMCLPARRVTWKSRSDYRVAQDRAARRQHFSI